jgi:hypothetical protein
MGFRDPLLLTPCSPAKVYNQEQQQVKSGEQGVMSPAP